MPYTLTKIVNAIKAPLRRVWSYDMRTLFVDNPKAIEYETYGERSIAGCAPGHNHSIYGGELIRRTLLSLNLGPQALENSAAAGGEGIPLLNNDGFVASPKLLMPALVTLPGGLSRLRGAFVIESSGGPGTLYLTAAVRAIHWHNFKFGIPATYGVTAYRTGTINVVGSGAYLFEFSLDVADLAKVKYAVNDARAEFLLYQSGNNLGATGVKVVCGELWIDDDPTPATSPPTSDLPTSTVVTLADILTGKILVTQLSRKIRQRLNSLAGGVLGIAPGLDQDNMTSEVTTRWQRSIKGAHSHQGKKVPATGGHYIADGVCLRYPKISDVFPRHFGENSSALKPAGTEQVQGRRIHRNGALDAAWFSRDYEFDLEAGLGGLDLQLSLEPGNTDDAAKLMIHVGVFDERGNGNNLVSDITCDFHRREADDSDGLARCEVEPEENDVWVPNQNRRLVAKGVFTVNAKAPASQTATIAENVNAYRVSKVIAVKLDHPFYTLNGSARKTGRYILRLRLSLPISGGDYDSQARILAFEAIATKGY